MTKRFLTDKASGIPSTTSWSQAHNFASGFIILSLSGNSENLTSYGKELFSTIESQFSSLDELSLTRFKEYIHKALTTLPPGTLHAVGIGVVKNDVLYCVTQNTTLSLYRGHTMGTVLSTKELTFASGAIQPGDILVFVSNACLKWLKRAADIFIENGTIDECIDDFQLFLHQEKKDNDSDCVVLLAQDGSIAPRKDDGALHEKKEIKTKRKFWFPRSIWPTIPNPGFTRQHLVLFFISMVITITIGSFMEAHLPKSAIDEEIFKQSEAKYEEGKSLVSLNPEVAAQSLIDAENLLEESTQGKTLTPSDKTRIQTLASQIAAIKQKALREYTVTPSLFFDLALISNGAHANAVSFHTDTMLLLDTNKKAVYSVTSSKQADVVSGNLSNPLSVALESNTGYVLSDLGIEKINLSKKTHEVVIPKEDAWLKPAFLAVFDGNLYILDKEAGMIIRYTKTDTGFLPKQDYTNAAQDFSHVVAFAIDGNIWTLFDTGDIQKYAQGAADFFSIQGLDIPLATPKSLYTDPDTTNIYILDSGNNRVVVSTKDGKYVAQYKTDIAEHASNMVVSEKEKKIYLLVQDKIYAIDFNETN